MDSLNLPLLKRLCETPGIPGREDLIRDVVVEAMTPLVDELRVDALGNVIGVKKGSGGPRVMVAAHMDEIGFLVKHIDDKGFLRLQPVGGFDGRTLVAQRVLVQTADGRSLRGALQPAAKPIHILDPADIKPAKVEELFVDLGLTADEVKAAVGVGDMVTMDRTLEEMGNVVVSKSLDDRVSVFVMLEALRGMEGGSAEVIAVATVQEEVGLRGARAATNAILPDIAVALDTTLAIDTPGGAPDQAVTEQGKGVGIKVMDGASISHPKLLRHMRDLAEAHGIPHQLEILPRGGTDAGAMQLAGPGCPAITLSIPSRYVHTVNETAHRGDIAATIELLTRFLQDAGSRTYGYEKG